MNGGQALRGLGMTGADDDVVVNTERVTTDRATPALRELRCRGDQEGVSGNEPSDRHVLRRRPGLVKAFEEPIEKGIGLRLSDLPTVARQIRASVKDRAVGIDLDLVPRPEGVPTDRAEREHPRRMQVGDTLKSHEE